MSRPSYVPAHVVIGLALATLPVAGGAQAQPKQVVKPPVAQAWIDVATYAGMNMGMGSGDMMGQTLGALMGGGGGAQFGYSVTGPAGRWMDVTLYTSRNASLAEALQGVPQATGLAPTLKLQPPERPKPVPGDDEPGEWDYEPPRGRLVMYWGCSETVRPGQPKVVDLGTSTLAELAKFFESRRATKRGTHAAAGRPVWPSRDDQRLLREGASIAGQHSFTGDGVPDGFSFTVPPAQDIMPPMKVKQTDTATAILLEWESVPHARAYFLGSLGGLPDGGEGMVLWTSSELPDSGFGLFDYQTNAAVDGWLKDKVLLPPATTRCAIPKEAAGEGMLRAIAYGTELNLAHPPRPADPAVAWEPDWTVKIRVKSLAMSMLGMPGMEDMGGLDGAEAEAPADGEPAPVEPEATRKKKFNPFDVVKDAVKKGLP